MLWLTVIRLVCHDVRYPSGSHDSDRQWRISWCWMASLMRGQVCNLQALLGLTSAFVLVSKSLRTHGHILPFQIWDPTWTARAPHFITYHMQCCMEAFELASITVSAYNPFTRTEHETPFPCCIERPLPSNIRCLQSHYLVTAGVQLLASLSLLTIYCICHIAPSLRLVIMNSLQAYHHIFFTQGLCLWCQWSV
jgi:hypothetical protein